MTAAQRSSAATLIAAKGQTVTLTRRAAGAYNTANGTSATTTSTQTGKGVILPFASGLRKMAGTNIPAGDKQCLLSALSTAGAAITAPKVDDMLTDAGGTIYSIVDVAPLAPAGLDIIYELTVRAST
jgi:hypothetical protein